MPSESINAMGANATALAWKLTREPRFAERHRLVHDWSFARFPDPEFGEWYGYLHRDGTLSSRVKGTMWKGPFHLPRMLWFCAALLADPPAAPANDASGIRT